MGSPLCSDTEWLSSGIWVPSHSLDIASMLGLTFQLLPRNCSHLRAILLPIPEDAATSRGSFEAEKMLLASSGYLQIHILQHTDEGSHLHSELTALSLGNSDAKEALFYPFNS